MPGNKSLMIPLKRMMSSVKNLGKFESRRARSSTNCSSSDERKAGEGEKKGRGGEQTKFNHTVQKEKKKKHGLQTHKPHSSQQLTIRILPLQETGSTNHGVDSTHAKIVMELARQLQPRKAPTPPALCLTRRTSLPQIRRKGAEDKGL